MSCPLLGTSRLETRVIPEIVNRQVDCEHSVRYQWRSCSTPYCRCGGRGSTLAGPVSRPTLDIDGYRRVRCPQEGEGQHAGGSTRRPRPPRYLTSHSTRPTSISRTQRPRIPMNTRRGSESSRYWVRRQRPRINRNDSGWRSPLRGPGVEGGQRPHPGLRVSGSHGVAVADEADLRCRQEPSHRHRRTRSARRRPPPQ